jgi:three-Cys-motif partner protein
MAKDRWPELCKLVETDDGLPTRESGHWTEQKLFLWNRYIDITTRAMVGNPHWPGGLVYVDLFAGPGVCQLKETERRIPGSPIIAASAPKSFSRILLCEKDPALVAACRNRLGRTVAAKRVQFFEGNCNERVVDVARQIPHRSLTLAFIDPTGLHADFTTIATLADVGRVDLLVLFADAYDANRNIMTYYDKADSNLDRVLGPDSHWRDHWDSLQVRDSSSIRNLLSEIYQAQLKTNLGYKVFGEYRITCRRGALYRLIYASKHERGLEFWDKINRKEASGQGRLFD